MGPNDYSFFTDVYASTTYKLTFHAPGQNPWNTSETNNSWKLETLGTVGTLSSVHLSSTIYTPFVKSINFLMILCVFFLRKCIVMGEISAYKI